jgi:hypothetical protein
VMPIAATTVSVRVWLSLAGVLRRKSIASVNSGNAIAAQALPIAAGAWPAPARPATVAPYDAI